MNPIRVLLATILLFAIAFPSEQKGLLASYWGQFEEEGSLVSACTSKNYDILMLAFVTTFGGNRTPLLNLAGHCDVPSGGCRSLASQVETCQRLGVKILLSLGGAEKTYSLMSDTEAEVLATSLWKSFFSSNPSGPLGSVVLDGVDFDIEHGGFGSFAHLAAKLKTLAKSRGRTLLLGAAPQCPFPDQSLGPGSRSALSSGLFDFVWIQFYNNPDCHYDPSRGGDVSNVVESWKKWSSSVPTAKIYLGLPASPDAADDHFSLKTGFIPSNVLVKNLLPKIKASSNYGGIMLWSVFHDKKQTGAKVPYSASIKSSL